MGHKLGKFGVTARLLCPELCGCDTPDSPQVMDVCPAGCVIAPAYVQALQKKDCCRDTPTEALVKNPVWKEIVHIFNRSQNTYLCPHALRVEYPWALTWFSGLLSTTGCGALVSAKNLTNIDFCAFENPLPGALQFRYWCPTSCLCHMHASLRGCPVGTDNNFTT